MILPLHRVSEKTIHFILRVVLARLEAGLQSPEHGGILPSVSANNAPAPGRPPGNTHITGRGRPWKTRPACSCRSSSADMPPAPATPPGPSEEAGHKGRARAAGRVARRAAQTCASPSRDEWGRDPLPLLFRRAPSVGTHVASLRFRGSSRSYEMNSAQAPRAAIKQQDERRTEARLSRPPHTG